MALRATRSGRVSQRNARIGIASRVAEYSGWVMDHDLGAISPTTRCRNVTMISARMNAMTSAVHSGSPHPANTGVSQWCTAGLVMEPSASAHSVMPSWAPASRSVSSDAFFRAARAAALCAASSSSRCRRAEMSENSTATKNADAAMSRTVATRTTQGLLMIPPSASAARRVVVGVIVRPPRPRRAVPRGRGVRCGGPRSAGRDRRRSPRGRPCPAAGCRRGRRRPAGRRSSR